MAVAVGFNPAFELRELRIGQQLSPSVQVENRLRIVLRELDCQCWHVVKLPFPRSARQARQIPMPASRQDYCTRTRWKREDAFVAATGSVKVNTLSMRLTFEIRSQIGHYPLLGRAKSRINAGQTRRLPLII